GRAADPSPRRRRAGDPGRGPRPLPGGGGSRGRRPPGSGARGLRRRPRKHRRRRAPGGALPDAGRRRRRSLRRKEAGPMSESQILLESFLQSLAAGLLVGAVYGLMCVGLAMIFGIMRVINFAQGDFMMLGMYAALFILSGLGLPA